MGKVGYKVHSRLPQRIYVYLDSEGCLIAYGTLRECADLEEKRMVGLYLLNETGTVDVKLHT